MASLLSIPLLSSTQSLVNLQVEPDFNLTTIAQASAALKAGKLPTTPQLTTLLQSLLSSNLLQPEQGSRFAGRVGGAKLSKRGKEVVESGREVVEGFLRLVMEKNEDDKIQRFIYASSQASVDIDGNLETPDLTLPTSTELAEARDSLKQLLTLLITSDQLRSLLTDSINLFRDLFADAAEQVANASIQVTRTSKKAANKARKNKVGKEDVDLEEAVERSDEVAISAKDIKKKVGRAAEDAVDDVQKNIQKKTKQVRKYVDEKLPTDAKDAAIERFKAIIDEIQSSPEYSEALDTLLSLVRKYATLTASSVKEAAASSTAQLDTNSQAETAASLFREIIEAFTGPLDSVLRTADRVIKDVQGDERIKTLFDEAGKFLDRAIYEQGYATSSKAQRKAEDLYDRAQALIQSNATWKRDADALVVELNKSLDKASNDRALVGLGRKLEKFETRIERFGKSGIRLAEGSEVWNDLVGVMLPRVLEAVKMIPLPRVEYTSEDFDLIIDGVKFTSSSFIPDSTHFSSHIDLHSQKGYAAYSSSFSTSTTLSIGGLRLQAKDISYYIHKKTGWIGLEDAGLLDIYVGSESKHAEAGLDVTITLENAREEDRESFFVVKKVQVAVEGFNIKVHDSRHFIRNYFARPALRSYLEGAFISVLEEQITTLFKEADTSLFAFQQRAIGAGLAAPDPLTYLRALFTPTTSASGVDYTQTGITKVGPKGTYVLAIGVEEELLPGKRTGLGLQGLDVASRKKQIEGLMEEGRANVEEAIEVGQNAVERTREELEGAQEELQERETEERKRGGWKSDAFDF